MDREHYYFLQPVTETELNDAFDEAENAMRSLMSDQALIGIFQGGAGAQHFPVPDLTVDVGGPCNAYDSNGRRLFFSSLQNVNVAQDSASVSTSVAGVGNEKWVSVAIKFTRVLSDPRIDGNSNTIYFEQTENFTIIVTQGAEALVGAATRPALDPDALLLFDVHRTFGQTQIFNADISITRRQDTIVLTQSPLSIRAGTISAGIAAMLTNLNNHINGVAGEHPATAITTLAEPNWDDATNIGAGTVQSTLDAIVNQLASQAGSGGDKIGSAAIGGGNPFFSLLAGSLRGQLGGIVFVMNLMKGGQIIPTYASVAALRAVTSANIPLSAFAFVTGLGLFFWSSTSNAVDDGVTVIRPTDEGGNGRFLMHAVTNTSFATASFSQDGSGGMYGTNIVSGNPAGYTIVTGTTITLSQLAVGDVVDLSYECLLKGPNGELPMVVIEISENGGGFAALGESNSGWDCAPGILRGKVAGSARHVVLTAGNFQARLSYLSANGGIVQVAAPASLEARAYRP